MFRLPFLLLHAFILPFIPHRLFRWFVSCLCALTAQTLRTGLIGNNSWVGFMTESPINEILITHIINAVTQSSSFTCDPRPRTNCFYFLPKSSQQFLLPFFITLSLNKCTNSRHPLEQIISQKKMSKCNCKAQNWATNSPFIFSTHTNTKKFLGYEKRVDKCYDIIFWMLVLKW